MSLFSFDSNRISHRFAIGLAALLWLTACGDDDPAPATPSVDAGRADLGAGDGSDVITIGDSWMAPFIQPGILTASGQPYRTYGVPGTRLLNEAIPGQYTAAKTENPNIKTAIMTAGGNDIIQVPGLRADCDARGAMCTEVVTNILNRLSGLWDEMAADGVRDVIYIQYATPAGENIDFALPNGDGVTPRCADVPDTLRCHQLPTLDIVMGDIPDGIHPSTAAAGRIGQAVYDMMVQRGMRR